MSTPAPDAAPANILVVDDTPSNLKLLANLLKDYGYKARPVSSGERALRAAQSSLPDLVLLDINMPGLDGYEVCARFKADPALAAIPIIFISGLNEPMDKVRAFEVGGVDYITKPFQLEEVAARVSTHLELRRKQNALAESITRLRELEQMRDRLMHMIVHDMRSPLVSLQMAIDIACESTADPDSSLAPVLKNARQSVVFLVEMVAQILDLNRLEEGVLILKKAKADLVKVARNAIENCRYLAVNKVVDLQAPKTLWFHGDTHLLQRVIGNLVGNALKFTGPDGKIIVSLRTIESGVRIAVRDNGPGIAAENFTRIFDKFVQIEGPQRARGSGLGLAFVKMVVEAHQGKVGVESALKSGSTFWIELPAG